MGIVAGLLEFDTANIDNSIGPLLEGLKTAFITSLSGMLSSILYKGLVATGFLTKKVVEGTSTNVDEITASDLYAVMMQQAKGVEQLQKTIGDDSDSSLIGQFKLMRSDVADQNKQSQKYLKTSTELLSKIEASIQSQQQNFQQFEDRLWIKLQDFADMLSKSATEQVVEALKTVIQDFNQNLTEQFGENFKQLNAAVIELVTWQENYKLQLADMRNQYSHGVQAISQTEISVAHIREQAQAIPLAMDHLGKVMEVNQHQIEELSRHLGAFEQVRDKAVEAVPEIRSQIDSAIAGARLANEEMAKGVQDSTEALKLVVVESAENYRDTVDRTRGALDDAATTTANSSQEIKEQFSIALEDINATMRNLVAELQDGGKQLNESYKESSNQLSKELSDIQNRLANTIEEQAHEHKKQADRVFAGLEGSIQQALSNTGESVEKQVKMIDQALEHELGQVMQSMGGALASISGQFTNDYKKLVRQMHDLALASQEK
ncbi:hypothetical protein DC094_19385 [Pelagibaculum spongiae]|uniref:Uncharacterized protein n=2 Tax=Pelagibaculum spongiae TaxID=2080658 RepID=A0A2V1GW83_9GAMM|nr:hypothetical protein DC094_19385 [Pelagibaculum spongiae]